MPSALALQLFLGLGVARGYKELKKIGRGLPSVDFLIIWSIFGALSARMIKFSLSSQSEKSSCTNL